MDRIPSVQAARVPVTDTFHGIEVTEEYRWLEDASSEQSIAWTKAQQRRSDAYFGGIAWRDALRTRVEQLLRSDSPRPSASSWIRMSLTRRARLPANLMGGSVAWRQDGAGFWYTRCADPAGFRQQVWFRELGDTPDRVDLAGPFADERIAENYLSASPDAPEPWPPDRDR